MAILDVWLLLLLALPIVALFAGTYAPATGASGWRDVVRRSLRVYLLAVAPLLFLLMFDTADELDCCNSAAFFSPSHRKSVYAIVALTWLAYAASARRKQSAPPLLELLINITLVGGILLTIAVFVHATSFGHESATQEVNWLIATLGCAPIIVLLYLRLWENTSRNARAPVALEAKGWAKVAWRIVRAPLAAQVPLLMVLLAPFLALLSALLLLFGQQPDSLVRAFTDTHHYGLSALRQQCLDVQCRGHYLCTIAVMGHPKRVKPLGYGHRGGRAILCNRQLLVANAFEQLLQEKLPRFHARVRRSYDKVGGLLQRHYRHFANPWVCDVVYWSMKPLELAFVVILYLCVREPERHISRQYDFQPFVEK